MRVSCEIEEIEIENENGIDVESINVTCTRCEHSVKCYGRSDRSVRRAMAMLAEQCPEGEHNFYCDESEECL